MQVKTTKLSVYDGLELKEATFRLHSFPEHYHDCYSIGIIERGIERLYVADKELLAHAHMVTLINPFDIHSNSFFDNDAWTYKALYVGMDTMHFFQRNCGIHLQGAAWFPQQIVDDAYLYRCIHDIHAVTVTEKEMKIQNLICYLLQNYAIYKQTSTVANNAISDAAQYLQSSINDKIVLEHVAKRFGMNKYSFIRTFKAQTGLTPNSYLLLHRINKSKQLIAQGLPITAVALETGFYDQSHFNHYFKKYTGVAPLAFKKGIDTAS